MYGILFNPVDSLSRTDLIHAITWRRWHPMFSPLSFEAHQQLANLTWVLQNCRAQVLDSKVACLQARQACQSCNLQLASAHLEASINHVPQEKLLAACRRRLSKLKQMHRELNLDTIQLDLAALTDEYNATLYHIEVVQDGLMSLIDRYHTYCTAGLLEDFYKFEPKRITTFFEEKFTGVA